MFKRLIEKLLVWWSRLSEPLLLGKPEKTGTVSLTMNIARGDSDTVGIPRFDTITIHCEQWCYRVQKLGTLGNYSNRYGYKVYCSYTDTVPMRLRAIIEHSYYFPELIHSWINSEEQMKVVIRSFVNYIGERLRSSI